MHYYQLPSCMEPFKYYIKSNILYIYIYYDLVASRAIHQNEIEQKAIAISFSEIWELF